MATDSIVGGLFGMTPELYEMNLRKQEQATGAELAKLTPFQQAQAGLYSAGAQLGRGLGGLMGVEDPQLKQISMLNELASQFDTSTSGGVAALAQALSNRGLQQPAIQLGQRALEMRKLEAEAQAKTMERLTNEQKNAAANADASGAQRGTEEWSSIYKANLERLTTKDTAGSEFERTVESLNLSPEEKRNLKLQRVQALLNNDPSGLKAITAQIANLTLQEKQFKLDEEKKASEANKQTAIQKLVGLESSIDDSLATAAKALKLAPNNFIDASGQILAQNIPWTDQRALRNLVSSLQSDKAIGTLNELKSQSKTGATGFGALNQKELQLVLDKTRALDPSDKMFRENLGIVMNGWAKLRSTSIESRVNLQGKSTQLQELRALVKKGRAEGWTQEEKNKAESLKDELGVN